MRGEWSLRQSIQRRILNEKVRGAEGTTWKLVVGQEIQTALGKQGAIHIQGAQTTSKSQTPWLLLWRSTKSRADEVVNYTSVLWSWIKVKSKVYLALGLQPFKQTLSGVTDCNMKAEVQAEGQAQIQPLTVKQEKLLLHLSFPQQFPLQQAGNPS